MKTGFEQELEWGLKAVDYELGEHIYRSQILEAKNECSHHKGSDLHIVKQRLAEQDDVIVVYELKLLGRCRDFAGITDAGLEKMIKKALNSKTFAEGVQIIVPSESDFCLFSDPDAWKTPNTEAIFYIGAMPMLSEELSYMGKKGQAVFGEPYNPKNMTSRVIRTLQEISFA